MIDSSRKSLQYIGQCIAIIITVIIVCMIVAHLAKLEGMGIAVAVSGIYALAIETIDALVWQKVNKVNPDSLPTFFMGVSMVRLLSALIVITVYYFATGRGDMLMFFLVFMTFYIAILIHHSVFFSHLQK